MENIVSEDEVTKYTIDARTQPNFKWDIPLVFEYKAINYKKVYCGFVPGIVMQSVTSSTLESCQEKLTKYVKAWVSEMKKNNKPVPFFPTNDEIKEDYNPIKILRLK